MDRLTLLKRIVYLQKSEDNIHVIFVFTLLKCMWLYYGSLGVDVEASYTVSSCHRVRRLISKPAKRSCDVCFAQCTRRDERCVKTHRGSFTTAMHLLTTP